MQLPGLHLPPFLFAPGSHFVYAGGAAPYLLGLGILLLAATGGMLLFILLYLLYRKKRGARIRQLVTRYSNFISEIIICSSKEECLDVLEQPEVKAILQNMEGNGLGRRTLIRELVKMHKSVSGSSAENIVWLYRHLGLHADSWNQFRNARWHRKARAIQELAEMQQDQYLDALFLETNSKNPYIRTEAQIALVKMTGFEGLRFMDMITHPVMQWQQLCLLQELSSQNEFRWEKLRGWLRSPNETVIEFALRLIEVYKCFELHDSVTICLSHASDAIRLQAIKTLSEIAWEDTPFILTEHYGNLDRDGKLSVLQVLKGIATEAQLPFLITQLKKEDPTLKNAATKVIQQLRSDWLSIIQEHTGARTTAPATLEAVKKTEAA